MNWILLLALIAIAIFAIVAVKIKQSQISADDYPYAKIDTLFSPAERSFLGVLQQAVGDSYFVFGKVRIADVVSVRSMSNRGGRQRAFNRISAKHFDYVLCAKDDLSIVCVIELDDQSHQQRKRQARDAFLVGLCRAISLPLIQIPAQRAYSVSDLHAKVVEVVGQQQPSDVEPATIKLSRSDSQVTDAAPTPLQTRLAAEQSPQVKNQSVAQSSAPNCPKCASPMVHREVKSGNNAGKKFWGCSTFPKCRGVTVSL